MNVRLHPHAARRLRERGATEAEVVATVERGEQFSADFGCVGFRRDFEYNGLWRGVFHANKQIEAFTVEESEGWLVTTVIVKYF